MSDSVPSLDTLAELVQQIQQTHEELSAQVGKAVNISLTLRNWLIGHHISQYELRGSDRAQYGEKLFTELANRLKSVSNCNRRQLYRYVRFFRLYPAIVGTLPPKFKNLPGIAETSKNQGEWQKTGDRPCTVGLGNACFVCFVDGRFDRRIDWD